MSFSSVGCAETQITDRCPGTRHHPALRMLWFLRAQIKKELMIFSDVIPPIHEPLVTPEMLISPPAV